MEALLFVPDPQTGEEHAIRDRVAHHAGQIHQELEDQAGVLAMIRAEHLLRKLVGQLTRTCLEVGAFPDLAGKQGACADMSHVDAEAVVVVEDSEGDTLVLVAPDTDLGGFARRHRLEGRRDLRFQDRVVPTLGVFTDDHRTRRSRVRCIHLRLHDGGKALRRRLLGASLETQASGETGDSRFAKDVADVSPHRHLLVTPPTEESTLEDGPCECPHKDEDVPVFIHPRPKLVVGGRVEGQLTIAANLNERAVEVDQMASHRQAIDEVVDTKKGDLSQPNPMMYILYTIYYICQVYH